MNLLMKIYNNRRKIVKVLITFLVALALIELIVIISGKSVKYIGPKYEKVDIIAMSAGDTMEDMEQAYESGMDKYLVKPVNMESLCDILKEYS